MRNNKPSYLHESNSIFNSIGNVMKNGKTNNNATNYASMKSNVEAKIVAYDMAILNNPNTLSSLSPLWPNGCDESRTAYNMYSTSRKEINELKNDLLRINGNGKEYKCPLCEINPVKHLDHYVPRGIMPEYSVHPRNLILLCQECNEIKKELWIDPSTGNRLIFNAYFDSLSGLEVLICDINQIIDGFPNANIKENPIISHTPMSQLEYSTYLKLGIIDRYIDQINTRLRNECVTKLLVIKKMKDSGMSFDEIWAFIISIYKDSLSDPNLDLLQKFLYKGIITSTVVKQWFVNNS